MIPVSEALVDDGDSGTFDFAFVDGDKLNYIHLFEYCMKLVRPGGIIACDNVSWIFILRTLCYQSGSRACMITTCGRIHNL